VASPRITIVGLGPGGAGHVTAETLAAIERFAPAQRFVRTTRHPSAGLVAGATSFDDAYEAADSFGDVYAEIADRLVAAAAQHGHVLYAVPGSPLVLERTVATLRADARVDVELLPAMSFLDVAWARLGIDPIEAGVRLVDGHEFATAAAGATGALLVAHTHANWVLSDIKLAIDDGGSGELDATPVVLLQGLGTDAERIIHTTWAEMDRVAELDEHLGHLTSLYVPALGTAAASGYTRFHQLARTLREQCPWDVEQTHQSLVPYLIEEAYEVVDAIAALDPDDPASDEALIEELGDLLYQVEFHATIAEQEGRFTIADVTAGIHDKLVRRHPHVFGQDGQRVEADDAATVLTNWDAIKRAEKSRTSIFEGIPGSLPALSYADTAQRKAAKIGFDWPTVEGAVPKIAEETQELLEAEGDAVAEEGGDLLFAVVNVLRHLGVDPESALRAATNKFRQRFERVESLARGRGIDLHASDLRTLDQLWDEVKRVHEVSDTS
jgi:tetrapyrrole methylase family protein/MazG family protein